MRGNTAVSSFNKHKRVINTLLSQYFPSVYYQLCPTGVFPRAEFELRQLNVENIPFEKYILTLNCFDKGQDENINDAIDSFLAAVDKSIRYTDEFYYQFFYQNDRQPVPDADKTIKRTMLAVEVRVYPRSEE